MNWNLVYELVKQIPRGRAATYGQIARAAKLRGGARAAGRAMAACPAGQGIPWHRVVGAGGQLLLREPNASLQRKLLESEGLPLAEKRILDFADHQWSQAKRAAVHDVNAKGYRMVAYKKQATYCGEEIDVSGVKIPEGRAALRAFQTAPPVVIVRRPSVICDSRVMADVQARGHRSFRQL